jgi:hypothetical protein
VLDAEVRQMASPVTVGRVAGVVGDVVEVHIDDTTAAKLAGAGILKSLRVKVAEGTGEVLAG